MHLQLFPGFRSLQLYFCPLFPWSPRSLAGIQMSASLSSPINNEISYILRQWLLNTWWWRSSVYSLLSAWKLFSMERISLQATRSRIRSQWNIHVYLLNERWDTSRNKQSRVSRVMKTKAKKSECKHAKGNM